MFDVLGVNFVTYIYDAKDIDKDEKGATLPDNSNV